MNLQRYEGKVHSQNGEDGIIQAITDFFDVSRTFVEIGCGDGQENNTRLLATQGWSGVWIDRNAPVVRPPEVRQHHQIHVTRDNIVSAFETGQIDKRVGLLSLDIDGNDYHVLLAILKAGYRPHVLVLEYNPKFKANEYWVMPYNPNHEWDLSYYYGASFLAMAQLCMDFGYTILGANSTGTNMFALRRPTIDEVYVPKDEYLYRNHRESDRIKDVSIRSQW